MKTILEIPSVETPRLILRAPCLEDFDAWAAFCADEDSMRYIGGVMDKMSAWRNMTGMVGSWHVRGFGVWSAIEKQTGRWVGRIGPLEPYGWPGTEVGYNLHPSARGKGYATEGAQAAIDFAFEHLGWVEVIHTIHPQNVASQAVARRLGSRREGTVMLPEPLGAAEKWVQTRAEWLAARPDRHLATNENARR